MLPCFYLRYSDNVQKPTSIEDQIRNCNQLAERLGIVVSKHMHFSDYAITGRAKGTLKRTKYQELLEKVENGEIDTIIVDEFSRLTRDFGEGYKIIDIIERLGVRVISVDGIDTKDPNWKMIFTLKILSATQEVEKNGDRTRRGMIGALKRGFQIAKAPYGYDPVRQIIPGKRGSETTWVINSEEEKIVKEIFKQRYEGRSLAQIAVYLNEHNVPPPGKARANASSKWIVGSIDRLVRNTIYRGEFRWNGSYTYMHAARQRNKEVSTEMYEREKLRMVTDDVWYQCNKNQAPGNELNNQVKTYTKHGAGKLLLAGVVRCGDCNALLSTCGGPKSYSMYCPQCSTLVRCKAKDGWVGYTSVAAATNAINAVFETIITKKMQDEFHKRLALKINGSVNERISQLETDIKARQMKINRLKSLASNPTLNPTMFIDDLAAADSDMNRLKNELKRAQSQAQAFSDASVELQMKVDFKTELKNLLFGTSDVQKTKAILRRLLTKFSFVERIASGISVFEIEFAQGVAAAELSGTSVIDDVTKNFRVTVSTTKVRPTAWSTNVEVINELPRQPVSAAELMSD